jgi:hypothetical protein
MHVENWADDGAREGSGARKNHLSVDSLGRPVILSVFNCFGEHDDVTNKKNYPDPPPRCRLGVACQR